MYTYIHHPPTHTQDYIATTGRRITFEWALIHGRNDSPYVANNLGQLLKPLNPKCHVNIIPLNPTQGFQGQPGRSKSLDVFIDTLAKHGVSATARVRRGIDIDAGCGQLTQKKKEREARARQSQSGAVA